jgi:HAD superfamily hydrolase (TIGR01509 family)
VTVKKRKRFLELLGSVEAVILDLDGTLINSERAWVEGTNAWLKGKGKSFDPELRCFLTGKGQNEVTKILKEHYNLEGEVQDLRRERLEIILPIFQKETVDRPGAKAFLKLLSEKGLRLAIASGAPVEFIKLALEMFGWEGYFQVLVSGDEVENGKPHPGIFVLCAEKLQIPANKCLVVEDSLNGVKAAKSAGMKCVAVPFVHNSGQRKEIEELADLVLRNLAEVL